uniref:Uncharacterized protein n=1 Tax=Setaria viridis TaxID=4556 RepID=A0A4U6SQ61_SETVI|nr:hypothetical protein SEVIR_9G041750v2 [Setaria viridis]
MPELLALSTSKITSTALQRRATSSVAWIYLREDRLVAEMVLPGDPRRREGVPEDELPRHEAGDRSAAAAAAGIRRWQGRQRLLRARAAQAVRRRGAEAGAGRRGGAERGEGGRGGGRVREGPGCRRGGARVARRRDGGVHGVQGGAERLLACPGAAAPRAARQLRAPRLRPDRHDRQLRPGPARGRRRPGGRRGAAPRRRLLPGRQAGPLRVTHSGSIGTGCW